MHQYYGEKNVKISGGKAPCSSSVNASELQLLQVILWLRVCKCLMRALETFVGTPNGPSSFLAPKRCCLATGLRRATGGGGPGMQALGPHQHTLSLFRSLTTGSLFRSCSGIWDWKAKSFSTTQFYHGILLDHISDADFEITSVDSCSRPNIRTAIGIRRRRTYRCVSARSWQVAQGICICI